MGQRSFFDVENRLQSVSKMGDPLERLATTIPLGELSPVAGTGAREGAQVQGRSQAN